MVTARSVEFESPEIEGVSSDMEGGSVVANTGVRIRKTGKRWQKCRISKTNEEKVSMKPPRTAKRCTTNDSYINSIPIPRRLWPRSDRKCDMRLCAPGDRVGRSLASETLQHCKILP